jgi:hypothetical protein
MEKITNKEQYEQAKKDLDQLDKNYLSSREQIEADDTMTEQERDEALTKLDNDIQALDDIIEEWEEEHGTEE